MIRYQRRNLDNHTVIIHQKEYLRRIGSRNIISRLGWPGALLLLVLPFEASLSDKEWEEKEIQLVKDIQRGENQVDGSKTKLMLILIQEREYLKSQEGRERAQIAKERVLSLRRCVDFDSKRVHLVYTADLSNEKF